jgi:hypothetical protein
MYLSYSGWKKYGCQFAYWNSYINKTRMAGPDDRLGSVFGSVVGKLFEAFYNEELYRRPQAQGEVMSRVDATIAKVLQQETTSSGPWRPAGTLLWKGEGEGQNPKALYANVDELAADARDAVSRGFRIIRHYRLLGADARAEIPLDTILGKHKLGGRADIILRRVRPHNDEVVLDGKGSRWRESYSDNRQLQWYAMLFRRKFDRLPDRLGFIYWRYDPPESLDLFEVKSEEVDAIQEQVLADIRQIEELSARLAGSSALDTVRKVFLPIATSGADQQTVEGFCRFCPFGTDDVCPAGAQVKKEITLRKSVV